jgi:hypothetical protein
VTAKPITFKRVIKFLASLKLAVVIILAIAALTAWGTIVESKYNAQIAQHLVYHSIYMYFALGALATSLIAVMVDRWPWQRKHTGFVLAHIGIITLITGSIITRYWGVDGSVAVGIGESSQSVTLSEADLTVYASLDGDKIRKLYDYSESTGDQAQFFGKSFDKKPLKISIPEGEITVVEQYPFAFRNEKIIPSKVESDGAAIRFQLENPNVNVVDWLIEPAKGRNAEKDLGPAKVVLSSREFGKPTKNSIILTPASESTMQYWIFTVRNGEAKETKSGLIKPGETIETGWMGLKFRLVDFFPTAKEEISFKPLERPTELTTPAIKIRYQSKEHTDEHWLGLNSMVKLFSNDAVYIVSFMNRRISLGFPITLKQFKVGRYQGTMRAASYESVVEVPGLGERRISMNEPLEHKGFTVYQASFNEDETGKPVASIFSVNYDPGRWVKYLGSLLIVFGSIHMFYFKRRKMGAQT